MSEDTGQEIAGLQVKQVMNKQPITIDSQKSVREAAILMDRSGCGCLLVTSKERVVGIVTERDMVGRVLARGGRVSRTRVRDIMSAPLVVVKPEVPVEEAAKTMSDNKVRRLPVVGERGLLGLLTVNDIANALAEKTNYCNAILNALARAPSAPENIYR